MKASLCGMILLLWSLNVNAIDFTTSGDGKTYSFEALSALEGSGVTKEGDVFVVDGTIAISEGDFFKIDEGIVVEFCDNAEVILKCPSDLQAHTSPTTLTRHGEATTCYGLNVQSASVSEVENITFDYVGLRGNTPAGMNVRHCTFTHHNGNASGALFLGGDGAAFTVEDCHFELCQKAAIGGAANYFCPATITGCTFIKNSQANGNIPQLNLTSASDITISNCTVEGDSTLNMVGGIGVSNFFGYDNQHITISGCTIKDNRYGITTMGVMDVKITDNQIINNRFETNPNNGGSGISLYDPYLKQNVYLGNNVFKDNGNSGVLYDLYNNSTNTIYAQGNIWNVALQDEEHIEEVIFHKHDNPSLGEVLFMPAGDPEGIRQLRHRTTEEDAVFSISGTRLPSSQALPHGVYIINGKKILK